MWKVVWVMSEPQKRKTLGISLVMKQKIGHIRRKWRSGAQNNPTVGQPPSPHTMEPLTWPAVSTTQP